MVETRYKFLRLFEGATTIRSENGDCTWTIGEWQSVATGEVEMCESGFHCSRRIYQAFSYVQGEILAEVEVDGAHEVGEDKEAWEKMRLIRCWQWRKEDSVALAIYAAELVLANFEKAMPDDDRPRKAIEAAKAWLATQDEAAAAGALAAAAAARSARSAAESAWSAWSAAAAAAAAAESAESAWSARSAAESAWSAAAWSAAAAESAAAESAAAESAESAAEQNLVEQIGTWMEERKAVLVAYPAQEEVAG